MLLENNMRPLNESEIHFELKQIAKYILKNKGYSIIGEEVRVSTSTYLSNYPYFEKNSITKNLIDIVGLKLKGTFHFSKVFRKNKYKITEPTFECFGIESKASLQDFKNGFCCTPEKVCIIAPKGIISVDLVPDFIGLIEVDLQNYEVKFNKRGVFEFKGIQEVKKPKKRLDDKFVNKMKHSCNRFYQNWCKDILRYIAYRQTNIDLYKNNQIEIKGRWRGRK